MQLQHRLLGRRSKKCGHVNNLPTVSDLAQIASAIYEGNPSINADGYTDGLTYKAGTASSLGLPEPDFSLWSGEEHSAQHAYFRGFVTSYTRSSWGSYTRDYSGRHAVCLGD